MTLDPPRQTPFSGGGVAGRVRVPILFGGILTVSRPARGEEAGLQKRWWECDRPVDDGIPYFPAPGTEVIRQT
jgi:hypothetical protein